MGINVHTLWLECFLNAFTYYTNPSQMCKHARSKNLNFIPFVIPPKALRRTRGKGASKTSGLKICAGRAFRVYGLCHFVVTDVSLWLHPWWRISPGVCP